MRVFKSENPVDTRDELLEEKIMQKEHAAKRSSGSGTIAIDERELFLRHRLIQLLAVLLAAATALGIYQIFIH